MIFHKVHTTLLVAVQKVVDQVVGLYGVVQAYLADASADWHIGTDPKFVRGTNEIRLERFRPCDQRETRKRNSCTFFDNSRLKTSSDR